MSRWLQILLRGAIELVSSAFVLLLVWQALAMGVNYSPTDSVVLCAGGILIFLALMAAHELGHLLAGWAMRLRFMHFTIGLLQVVRADERLQARLNAAWFRPAASVMFDFPWGADALRRWAVMVLGGPLSNLLLSIVCLFAASWLNPGPQAEMPSRARSGWRNVALLYPGDLPTAFLNVTGVLSLGLGLGTLVPARVVGLRTDGGQLLDLWRFRKVAQTLGTSGDTVLFVVTALAEICKRRRQERGKESEHVSAREFCDYLLVSRGEETAAILRVCNLRRSEDVGRIIFGLVNAGLIGRRESDSETDFQGLFVLE